MLEKKYVSEGFPLPDSQQNYGVGKVMKSTKLEVVMGGAKWSQRSLPILESLYELSVTPQFPYLKKPSHRQKFSDHVTYDTTSLTPHMTGHRDYIEIPFSIEKNAWHIKQYINFLK